MKKPALKEYQSRAISYGLENPYCILALDPGLGKSRCAIEIREKLKLNCLVVCPGYLVLNWEKEIRKWAGDTPDITKFKSGKQLYDVCDTDYVLISYDLVQKAPQLLEWADMVVLDEAPAIKSMEAKRSTFLHKNIFENSIQRVLLLTGTPIKNRVKEFYSLLALCHYDPHIADSQFLDRYPCEIDFADQFSFREEYTMEIRNRWVTILKWSGIKNLEEMKQYLIGHYIRIKGDVLGLPPVSYKSLVISDTPDKALLDSFNSHFSGEGNDSINPTAKAEAALKKVPFTVKYARDLLEETDCILIYSDHVASTEAIAKEFGVTPITGKMAANTRSQLADEFQAGKGNVLVATIGSMKEGKDLFRSHNIIFNDYPWVPGDLKQVIHRIQRIGQKHPCLVHRIIGSPQDEYIMNTISSKIETIERAT